MLRSRELIVIIRLQQDDKMRAHCVVASPGDYLYSQLAVVVVVVVGTRERLEWTAETSRSFELKPSDLTDVDRAAGSERELRHDYYDHNYESSLEWICPCNAIHVLVASR